VAQVCAPWLFFFFWHRTPLACFLSRTTAPPLRSLTRYVSRMVPVLFLSFPLSALGVAAFALFPPLFLGRFFGDSQFNSHPPLVLFNLLISLSSVFFLFLRYDISPFRPVFSVAHLPRSPCPLVLCFFWDLAPPHGNHVAMSPLVSSVLCVFGGRPLIPPVLFGFPPGKVRWPTCVGLLSHTVCCDSSSPWFFRF